MSGSVLKVVPSHCVAGGHFKEVRTPPMSGAEPEVASFFAVIEKLPCQIRSWVVGAWVLFWCVVTSRCQVAKSRCQQEEYQNGETQHWQSSEQEMACLQLS
jgi:hypothetical protein